MVLGRLQPAAMIALLMLAACLCSSCRTENAEEQVQDTPQQEATVVPADWIRVNLDDTGVIVYFPETPMLRETSSAFWEDYLHRFTNHRLEIDEGILFASAIRTKPEYSELPDGVLAFTRSQIDEIIKFQHSAGNYDLENDPEGLVIRLDPIKIDGNNGYTFQVNVRDGVFYGKTLQKDDMVILLTAAHNHETQKPRELDTFLGSLQ